MPFSNSEQISPIVYEVIRMQPKSILDVGCGLGLYGFLCRIYLDLYYDVNFSEKLKDKEKTKWSVRIDAIEGTEDYLPFIPTWAYNDVIVGNASEIIPGLKDRKYDLILALAILEHLTKEEGVVFLKQLKRIGQKIILSVPKQWGEQEVVGNPYETHRSHWTDTEFIELGFNKFLPHPRSWIAVYAPDTEKIIQADKDINSIPKNVEPFLKTSDDPGVHVLNRINEIDNSLKLFEDKLNAAVNLQNMTLDRLSVTKRIKNLVNRLLRIFLRR